MSNKLSIKCENCHKEWIKADLQRSCSNCFACTGCETYICPNCNFEIVVIPIKPMKRASDENNPEPN